MGVSDGDSGTRPPRIWTGDANANWPPDCQVSKFQGSVHLQRPPVGTKPSLQVESSTFLWRRHGQKIPHTEYTKTRHFKWKIIFSGEGLGVSQTPLSVARVIPPTSYPPSTPSLWNPPLCSPRIPSRFTPQQVGQRMTCTYSRKYFINTIEEHWLMSIIANIIGRQNGYCRQFWRDTGLLLIALL